MDTKLTSFRNDKLLTDVYNRLVEIGELDQSAAASIARGFYNSGLQAIVAGNFQPQAENWGGTVVIGDPLSYLRGLKIADQSSIKNNVLSICSMADYSEITLSGTSADGKSAQATFRILYS